MGAYAAECSFTLYYYDMRQCSRYFFRLLYCRIHFSLPGLGRYFISAISDRDYFVVLGLNVVITGIYVCSILVSDILLMLLDPRIRVKGKGETG